MNAGRIPGTFSQAVRPPRCLIHDEERVRVDNGYACRSCANERATAHLALNPEESMLVNKSMARLNSRADRRRK